uniref:SHSP domain-containing protein n=1 Tax=Arcella intermedia TaxID=1963864 RepID=A0A6B2LRL3_9EUKA
MGDFPDFFQEEKNWTPRVDIAESKTDFHVDAEVPGMTKDNIKIKIKDGVLELSGERNMEKKEENEEKHYKRVERMYGSFTRRIQLPKNVDTGKVSAKFENGILKVVVPKTKPSEGEEGIEVRIHE